MSGMCSFAMTLTRPGDVGSTNVYIGASGNSNNIALCKLIIESL